jgi:hypothetical protein
MISIVCLVVFVLACSTVGLRLLWVAAHGGGSPAWSCGIGFTSIALFGYPLSTVAGVGRVPVGEVNLALGAAGVLLTAAGLASFYAFTLTAFRLRTPWAWGFTIGAIVGLAVTAIGEIVALATADPAVASAEATRIWANGVSALSTVCYAWIAVEGLGEWSKARKRVALGLGDPVVANRILLWGLFGLSTTGLNLFLLGLRMAGQSSTGLASQAALAFFGLLASVAVALAFVPPKWWTERVRARAAATHA